MEKEKNELRPEYFCTLHSLCSCPERGYDRKCNLRTNHKFAIISCLYRESAMVFVEKVGALTFDEYKEMIKNKNPAKTKMESKQDDDVDVSEDQKTENLKIEDVF